MPLPAWPLGYPAEGTYREQPQSSAIPFGTEVGAGKRRRRSTATAVATSFRTIPLSVTDKDALIAFHDVTLMGGSLRFEMNNPDASGANTYRFSEAPAFSVVADWWIADIALVRLD